MKKSLNERLAVLESIILEADDEDKHSDSTNISIDSISRIYRNIANKQEPSTLDSLIKNVIKENKPGTESLLLQLVLLKAIVMGLFTE